VAVCNVNGAEVNVYAAASLTDVMKEIVSAYEKESDDKILFNFGAYPAGSMAETRKRKSVVVQCQLRTNFSPAIVSTLARQI
jgi:ABC-type molybdate transport system substrate-binding protein